MARGEQDGDVRAERRGHEEGGRRLAIIEDGQRVRDVVVKSISVRWMVARPGPSRVEGKEPKSITEASDLVAQDPRIDEVPGRDEEDRTKAFTIATPADPDAITVGDPDLIWDGLTDLRHVCHCSR